MHLYPQPHQSLPGATGKEDPSHLRVWKKDTSPWVGFPCSIPLGLHAWLAPHSWSPVLPLEHLLGLSKVCMEPVGPAGPRAPAKCLWCWGFFHSWEPSISFCLRTDHSFHVKRLVQYVSS